MNRVFNIVKSVPIQNDLLALRPKLNSNKSVQHKQYKKWCQGILYKRVRGTNWDGNREKMPRLPVSDPEHEGPDVGGEDNHDPVDDDNAGEEAEQ